MYKNFGIFLLLVEKISSVVDFDHEIRICFLGENHGVSFVDGLLVIELVFW